MNPGYLFNHIRQDLKEVFQLLREAECPACGAHERHWMLQFFLQERKPAFMSGGMQELPLESGRFDGVACVHVLEHVDDDHRALDELWRILKPGGQALVMVPFGMHLSRTVEFGRGHELMYGHVRDYSPHDFQERLNLFEVEEVRATAWLDPARRLRHGIPDSQIIHLCTRPAT